MILSKEARNQVVGFICGQIFIQTILITCFGLVLYEISKLSHPIHGIAAENGTTNGNDDNNNDQSNKRKLLGHGFWIPLLLNITFHIGVVSYLVISTIKDTTRQLHESEEMTAIIVHRRVPSRIPKEKLHRIKSTK
jgi:Ca2+/H+ antiporter